MKYFNKSVYELPAKYRSILKKYAFLNATILMSVTFAQQSSAAVERIVVKEGENVTVTEDMKALGETTLQGGAISNTDGKVNISDNITFSENIGNVAAAISSVSTTGHKAELNIGNNVVFDSNKADTYAGAILVQNSNLNIGDNVAFTSNENGQSTEQHSGGAIAIDSNSANDTPSYITLGNDSVFSNNKATKSGGALYVYESSGEISVDVKDGSTFKENKAGVNGGAIAVYGISGTAKSGKKGFVLGENTKFDNNSAELSGGAIYLSNFGGHSAVMEIGDNSSFTNNTAVSEGGAIYNTGTIKFKGNTIFSGNTANGKLNDIYNDGQITFWNNTDVTLDGGITGSGEIFFSDRTTLNAKLNTTTISAGTINFEGNNTINLTVDNGLADDEYMFISGSIEGRDDVTIADNTLYDLSWKGDTGSIILSKKSTAEVVSELAKEGVNAQQATTISAFADSKSDNALLNTITEAVQSGNAKSAAKLADEVAPTTSQTVMGVAQGVNSILSNVANARMAAVGRSGGDAFVGGAMWVQGLMNHTKQDSTSNTAGFSADTYGISFGIDGKINEDLMIGVGYGYTNTDADSGNRNIDVDGHNFFAYTEYKPNKWYINGMFNYGFSKYDEQKIAGLKAKYDVNTYALNVMTGYDFDNGLTPEIGLRYLLADQDSYNDGVQHIGTDKTDVLTGVVGVKYKADVKAKDWQFTPNIRLAATYDMMSDDSKANVNLIGGGNYQITGKRLERFGIETGVGIETTYENWNFSVDYNGGFRKDFQSHTGMLKAKYNF